MLVDIHNHILFGLDDGAQTSQDSIQMAKQAAENGITHIIATPHHKNGKYNNPSSTVQSRVEEVNQLLNINNIPLTVVPGMEISLYADLINDIKSKTNDLLTLNRTGKYVLIELPDLYIPANTEMFFYELQIAGLVPIIAHAERNAEFYKDPNRLYTFIQKGALAQITAGSLIGTFGKKLETFSAKLLKYHLAHFIASDAHNVNRRGSNIQAAYTYLEKQFSASFADYFRDNAIKILKGEDFTVIQPKKFVKKRWFFNFT